MEKKKQTGGAVELKELVYAPLSAISAANIRLSSNIVDFLATTGDMGADQNGKPVVQLGTIQMQYEKLRNDADEGTVADYIGLEVPLLSIYPISTLKVSKTKVSFDTEIQDVEMSDDGAKIYTRVCSKKQRDGANAAKISYEVELESVSVPEGLARFIDTLNSQVIPKLLTSKPLDGSGKKLVGKDLDNYNHKRSLKDREAGLTARMNEIGEMIRAKNNAIKLETGMDYDDYLEHINGSKDEATPALKELCASVEELRKMSAELNSKLERVRQRRMKMAAEAE